MEHIEAGIAGQKVVAATAVNSIGAAVAVDQVGIKTAGEPSRTSRPAPPWAV